MENFWISSTRFPVTLQDPENNEDLQTTRPRFSWNSSPEGGPLFELEVSDRRDFSLTVFRHRPATTSPEYIREGIAHYSLLCPRNLSDGRYYWRVRQKREADADWGRWNEPGCFRVDVTAPEIRLVTPGETRMQSSVIPARVNVTCEIIDRGTGVRRVEFLLAGRKVAERNRPYEGSDYVAEIPGLNEGRNAILVKAYDNTGTIGNMRQYRFVLEVERVLGTRKPPLLRRRKIVPPGVPRQPLPGTPN